MRKDRLVENRVTLKMTGVEMINEIKFAKEKFYSNSQKIKQQSPLHWSTKCIGP